VLGLLTAVALRWLPWGAWAQWTKVLAAAATWVVVAAALAIASARVREACRTRGAALFGTIRT
jgi:hypothetical protein